MEEQKKDHWVSEKIASMSAKEKAGQILMWHIEEAELSSSTAKLLTDIPFGGIIIMGNHTKEGLTKLIDQINAIPAPFPRFIAIDQEGGTVKRMTDDANPGAAALSDMTPAQICGAYKNTSELLKNAGVTMNFGIVADIGWFSDGFITPRTLGKNPGLVTDMVEQATTCSAEILSTVKHFPGHGRTKLDSHTTIPVIKTPYDEWKTTDALPFQKAIEKNIPVIMLGHLIYQNMASEPASLSQFWIQELRDMGHKGLIITDDLGMLEKSGFDIMSATQKSLQAGVDILLIVQTDSKPDDILNQIIKNSQTNSQSQLSFEKSLRRIAELKYKLQKN